MSQRWILGDISLRIDPLLFITRLPFRPLLIYHSLRLCQIILTFLTGLWFCAIFINYLFVRKKYLLIASSLILFESFWLGHVNYYTVSSLSFISHILHLSFISHLLKYFTYSNSTLLFVYCHPSLLTYLPLNYLRSIIWALTFL